MCRKICALCPLMHTRTHNTPRKTTHNTRTHIHMHARALHIASVTLRMTEQSTAALVFVSDWRQVAWEAVDAACQRVNAVPLELPFLNKGPPPPVTRCHPSPGRIVKESLMSCLDWAGYTNELTSIAVPRGLCRHDGGVPSLRDGLCSQDCFVV